MNEHIIEARKKYGKLSNLSKAQAKKGACIWCGKKITRFCNSHSIPQMVLDNIDTDGKLDYFNTIVKIPLINEDKGIGEAGTFKLICKECDSSIFQNYEDPKKIGLLPDERMLEEIVLKNMHICMFPLEKESVLFAFYHEDDHEYDDFKNQFLALEEEDKLSLLSYLVYEHSEDMIFAKKFPHRTWLINRVRETFMDTPEILGFSLDMVEMQKRNNLMKLKKRDKTFPNVLDKKFSIKE